MNKNKKNNQKNRQQFQQQGKQQQLQPKQQRPQHENQQQAVQQQAVQQQKPAQQKQQQKQQSKHPVQQPQELSYYRLLLLSFLKESHPELVGDSNFIAARADSAAEEYSESIRSGSTHDAAAESANQVLFAGLHFSRYDVIVTVLWNEFSDEVPQGSAKTLALQLLPVCEEVFSKYPLSDDFQFDPAFDNLYTEITGTILIWLDENGIQ